MSPQWQRCPNCGEAHDVSVHVSGHKLSCKRCALPFVVRRDATVSPARTGASLPPPAVSAAPAAAEGPAAVVPVTPPATPPFPSISLPSLHSKDIVADPTQPAGVKRPPPVRAAPPPRHLPGFELTDLLGRGGMGEVWKARQLSLGRDVAVKILSRELAQDPDFVRRFQTEASVLTNLSHPHIVAIIDRGRHQDLFYFAMELVEGKSLREKIAPGPLSIDEAAQLLGQLLSALHHAHQRGIVHRDLKPENVLLDGAGNVKVADFGLASLVGRTGDDRITMSSVAMGTMSYMAPEQRRDAHSVDRRADLYSAGVVLYELLTGEVPAGRFDLPSKLRPGLPKTIDAVLERALAAEPGDRYPNALEMARAISQVAAAGSGLLGAFARLFGGR